MANTTFDVGPYHCEWDGSKQWTVTKKTDATSNKAKSDTVTRLVGYYSRLDSACHAIHREAMGDLGMLTDIADICDAIYKSGLLIDKAVGDIRKEVLALQPDRIA